MSNPAVNELASLYIDADELSPDDSWRLVEWCHRAGADEFSMLILETADRTEASGRSIEQRFAAFEREPAPREGVMAMEGEEWIRPVPLWSLTPESIRQLQRVLPDGLFSYGVWTSEAWCENLCLYRETELMLGIVTHEQMGILRVTPAEKQALEDLGIRCHPEPPFSS